MRHTIIEKALIAKTNNPSLKPGDIVTIEPDRVMSHDNTAFIIKRFIATGAKQLWNKEKITIIFDHCVPAVDPKHMQNHTEARKFAEEHTLPHFYDDKAGVCHQVMCEEGLVLPGTIVVGADSHSTLYGAMNAVGIPINRTEMAGIWATGNIWLKVPQTIKINLEGVLPKGVYAKDIMLAILKQIKADGATYKSVEFTGSAIKHMSMSSRMTLTNMAVEIGAKCGIMPYDEITKEYLNRIGVDKSNYTPLQPDPDATYEQEIIIDVEKLTPLVACPHNVDNVKSIKEINQENNGQPTKIHQAYLGSCTNGRIEDLQVAADILKGKKIAEGVKLVVYPASYKIKKQAEEMGLLQALEEAGAHIMTASCGPCFGAVGATLKDGQVCISSSNRNFCGRMGSKNAFVYLTSPATVAASCVTGEITDPREAT